LDNVPSLLKSALAIRRPVPQKGPEMVCSIGTRRLPIGDTADYQSALRSANGSPTSHVVKLLLVCFAIFCQELCALCALSFKIPYSALLFGGYEAEVGQGSCEIFGSVDI